MKTGIKIVAVVTAGLAATTAHAQMTQERRANLLSFYPCGASLTDDELAYLGDWANAVKRDPCGLNRTDFTNEFVQQTSPTDIFGMQAVRNHFAAENKSVLFVQQVLLFGRDDADGIWGPQTDARFTELLKTYHAIGSVDEEWGVRDQADVPRFLSWVAAAEFANATGGEFPD